MEKNLQQHAALIVTVTKMRQLPAGTKGYVVKVDVLGCEDCIITALTLALLSDAEFRKIINAAGVAANKVRRGEADAPDFHIDNNLN